MAAPSPRRQAPLSLAVSVSALFSAFVYSLSLNASTVLGFFPGVEIALHERGLDRLLTASCMARLFQDCQVVRDQIAEQAPAAKPVALPPSPPALPSSVAPGDYEVYIQFAGTFTREQIVRVATVVRSRGWDVQGADQGGERTPAAAGRREVRYGPDEDEAAARALAAEFDALGLVAKPLAVKQFEIIPSHSLEVWISN